MKECKKIDDQKSLDELDVLVEVLSQGREIYREKIYEVEEMKMARNLLKLGFSIDVIPKIIG